MRNRNHRIFLTSVLLIVLTFTAVLTWLFQNIVCGSLGKAATALINVTFASFVGMIWLLFSLIIYYAKQSTKNNA